MTIFAYWSQLTSGETVHPEDLGVLEQRPHSFQTDLPPGHISGPLRTAPVVICYGNPGYDDDDRRAAQDPTNWALLAKQKEGTEPYPMWLPGWRKWITERTKQIDLSCDVLSHTVATFNIVPYASVRMNDAEVRLAERLPSVHAARSHLHNVLVPKATRGEIFLVIVRKHALWQVDGIRECRTLRIPRNLYVGGALGAMGQEIRSWLNDTGSIGHAL